MFEKVKKNSGRILVFILNVFLTFTSVLVIKNNDDQEKLNREAVHSDAQNNSSLAQENANTQFEDVAEAVVSPESSINIKNDNSANINQNLEAGKNSDSKSINENSSNKFAKANKNINQNANTKIKPDRKTRTS